MAKVKINDKLCKGCELCVHACPKKIMQLDKGRLNAKGYNYVFVSDINLCIGCAMCATICPDCVIEVEK